MESDCQKEGVEMKDEENGFDELKVGMEVSNEAEAYNLYNSYALKKGFSIRKGNIRRDSKNNIRERVYMCSKEGFYDDLLPVDTVKKMDTRTGCRAFIRFIVSDGVWKIRHINTDHNHEFAKPEERQFLRSGRKVPKAHANVISSMFQAGIRPTKSYSYLAKEVGGAKNVGFTKKDCLNYLFREKEKMIEGGDAQSLMNHFKQKQAEDPNFFYSVQVDQFTRMTNFFWRDGKSKLDYDSFGDVLCFDTTFRTNKYNLICAPFVGVNHHWKNVLFGCAFLLDETTKSFVWLLKTFLESMGNKQPITIFTDEDKAMANAIKIVFPKTRHRLCTWHISKNATQPLGGLYTDVNFKKQLDKCFYGCLSEYEFQATWDNMIKTFKLENHVWLKKLYSLREKWSSAFNLDYFSANIRATQRVESVNNVFHQISTKTMSLLDFVDHYEQKSIDMRLEELQEDFRCKNGMPHLQVKSGISKQAASEYTIKMFSFFEKELLGSLEVRLVEVCNSGVEHDFEAREEGNERVYKIYFNSATTKISCSCKLFQTKGLLCRHALKVFDFRNITSIPSEYILKRWTKGAKKGILVSNDLCESSPKKRKSAQSLRLSELMHEMNNVVSIASLSDSGTRIVKENLAHVLILLESDGETLNTIGGQKVCDVLNNESSILNPPTIKEKGLTNARIKSAIEKKKRKQKAKNTTVGSSSRISVPCTQPSSHPNQQLISGPPHPSHYNPSFQLFNDISSHNFGHPNFRFTNLLQGSDQISNLSEDSSRTLSANFTLGQSANPSQALYFNGFNQFHGW